MSEKVLVYIDQFKGKALLTSWEVVGAAFELAKELGDEVIAVVAGEGAKGVAEEAFEYGLQEVFFSEDTGLADYRAEPYATLVSKVAQEQNCDVLLFPTTTRGRELAAMCSIDLSTGVMPDVTALEVEDGSIFATRPIYAGKLISRVYCESRPLVITIRARAFSKPQPYATKSGSPSPVDVVIAESDSKSRVLGYSESAEGVSLTDAGVIVSGGRGVSNNPSLSPPSEMDDKEAEIWRAQEGFKLVEELAAVLNGAVGASRAAVDANYIPYIHQVGQTGKIVSPDLYIACGISGAIQHLAGMRTSKVIVAINKDSDAPIFKLARFGVVGNLYDILPPLTEAFRSRLGK